MASIGIRNILRVVRQTVPGVYLDGCELGDILVPRRYVPESAKEGELLDVFVYRDSEDRLVATTEQPYAQVGEFAFLRVVSSDGKLGAFLDWGLSKDLLLPIREQAHRVRAGQWVVAAVALDPKSGRLIGSTRLNRFLNLTRPTYAEGDTVKLLIAEQTELGYKAIVENAFWGLLYYSELSVPLEIGQSFRGYVRIVREDGKIDLRMDPAGYGRVAPLTEQILAALEASGGRLDFDDASSPEAIRAAFGTSKKAFKQALGALFRDRAIRFKDGGIEKEEVGVRR